MLDFHRQPWAPPQPPLRPAIRRAWRPPLASLAVQPAGAPLPPPSMGLPAPSVPIAGPLALEEPGTTLAPPPFPPPTFHPEAFPPPAGPPIDPDGTPRGRDRRRRLIGGAIAAAVVLGVALVGFGAFDSSDGSSSPENASRTQIENEPEVATPSGGPSSGAVPATPPRPSTPTGVDNELAPAPTSQLATGEAPGPASPGPADPADPPPGDAATADPPSAPLPLATAAPIGDRYVVAMTAVDLDATDIIVAEDPTNQPPAAGHTYVMVTLEVEFTGLVGEAEPYFDLLVGAVADDGRQFDDLGCVALAPDDMYGVPLIGPGGTVVGTFCLVVPTNATDDLTFFVEENPASRDTRVWWTARG